MVLDDGRVVLLRCTECELCFTEPKRTLKDDGWTVFSCWRCDHEIGVLADRGRLDLGITRAEQEHDAANNLELFFEEFMSNLGRKARFKIGDVTSP